MINKSLRRLQKFIFWIKILVLLTSLFLLGSLIWYTAPTLPAIIAVSFLLGETVFWLSSFLLSNKIAAIIGLSVSFLLFLKATALLTPVNLGLFAVFVLLLALYLWKK